jgi:hypothetical protein
MRARVALGLLLAGCLGGKEEAPAAETIAEPAAPPPPPAASAPARMELEEGKMSKRDLDIRERAPSIDPGSTADEPAPAEEGAPSRAWFPETFLFEPLVVTDARGAATVSVRVPDRLTSWRVLALAHSREGAQAGAVTRFVGTLDAYVDPVLPPFLLVGDEVQLPVQVVNGGAETLAAELRLAAENGTVAPASARVTVAAGGTALVMASLRTARPGPLRLRATLGQTDAVVRELPVLPAGRPVTRTVSGTLAARRELRLETPSGADPASSELRALVYPGAAAILRGELAGSRLRGGVAEDAYTLRLAGDAGRLLAAFGDQADPQAVRELTLLASQRVVRHARTLDVAGASLIAGAALAHRDNPVLARLGARAIDHLVRAQRPDGTFGGADGWTLQRLLVATADGARAVRDAGARQVAVRAQAAVERNLDRIDDAYTAAAVVAAGAASIDAAAKLRDRIRAAVETRDDGARVLRVADAVVRADGRPATSIEATALAILALDDPADAGLRADLGTAVLAAYRGASGWGDGRTNLVCLDAVLRLYADPVPEGVKVTLSLDGAPVAEATLDRARLREALSLSAPAPPGPHVWALAAEPPVPGLAYAVTLVAHVPWTTSGPTRGLELAVEAPREPRAGRPSEVVVRAAAPSGMPIAVVVGLPAGVQVDRDALDALVASDRLLAWDAADGRVSLTAPALAPGATLVLPIRVIPTLAGRLRAPASSLAAGGELHETPPALWVVR